MVIQNIAQEIKNTLYIPLFKKPWPIWAGALSFAVLNVFMAAYARGIGVFPQMSMWGASLYNALGIKTEAPFAPYPVTPVLSDLHSMINFGIILGVLAVALLSREFKLRTDSWRGYAQGLFGGALMGFGTVLTPPCNIGGFGTAIMAFSLSGYLMAVGLLPGAYIGARILVWQANRAIAAIDFQGETQQLILQKNHLSRQPLWGVVVIALLLLLAGVYITAGKSTFAGLLLFGALFGVIFQRSRLCFAAAFRDVFIAGDTRLLRWIVVSLLVGMVGFGILKGQGYVATDHFVFPAGFHNVVGGFVFGIGMIIAGGCGGGILWRGAEGYVRMWFAIFGGMLAAGSWVHIYGQQVGKGWLYGSKTFLPDMLGGWIGAFTAAGLVLTLFYLFLTWVEVKKR